MADVSSDDYQTALAATAPNSGVSDNDRTFALQVIQEFEDQHAAAQRLVDQLDPKFSLVPQALAVQPATTYPGGDTKAEQAWMVDRGKSAKGTVIYYEPPLSVAKKDLLEHPEMGRMLYPNLDQIVDPQEVANMGPGSQLFDDYKNAKWRETAEGAARAGKTVYRYAKAPWLQSDGDMGKADTLAMKADASAGPILSGMMSFIGGVDKSALFGAGDRVARALPTDKPIADNPNDELMQSLKGKPDEPSTEVAGGATQAGNYKDAMAQSTEEHPLLNYGGQALGMLSDWSPANMLFAKAAGLGGRAAQVAGGGLTARLATSGGAAAAAGAVDQGIREGVNATGDLAEKGETPITLQGAAANMGHAALGTGVLGAGLEGLGSASNAGANLIANGNRYRGIPGQLERAGYKFSPSPLPSGGVQLSPEITATQARANASDVLPGDLLARDIAPKIAGALDENVVNTIHQVGAKRDAFLPTDEGQQLLPVRNLLGKTKEILDDAHQQLPDKAEPIGIASQERIKDIFNSQIDSLSLKPVEGAVELTPEQAEAYLAPFHQRGLEPPKAAGGGGGSRELDLEGDAPEAEGAGSLAHSLRRRGIDKVYAVPRRYNAKDHEAVLKEIETLGGKAQAENPKERAMGEVQKAAFLDRDARAMDGVPGAWSKLQRHHSELLEQAKAAEKLGAPGGDSFRVLSQHGSQRPGELLTVEALRKAADKSGTREQLESIRYLDRVQKLRAAQNYGPPVGGGSRFGWLSPGAHLDAAAIRAFPVLRSLGGPMSFIRGGRGGVLGSTAEQDEEKKP